MAIITFTSDGKRETGQTLSCVAFATQMDTIIVFY